MELFQRIFILLNSNKSIDNIIANHPEEDIIWFYPFKDNSIGAEQLEVDEANYDKKGVLKRMFRTSTNETTEIAFFWLKTKEEFFQYFEKEADRANQILILDVKFQLFDNQDVKPFLAPLQLFQQQRKSIITIATSDANPIVQAGLISKDKNIIWGNYSYEIKNLYEDCQKTIEYSDKKWDELYNPEISIKTFLQGMSDISVADCHNWNDQTPDSVNEYIKEGSWDTEWQMPLQLSLLIKLLDFEPEQFMDMFALKRNGYFIQGHPIAECLKTLGNKDHGSISLLGTAFITWAAYRNVFGDLYPEDNKKFIHAIQNCKSSHIARYRLITPIQENPTLQKTILALYEMMKQLITNYNDNNITNFKSIKLAEKGLSIILQNVDFKQFSDDISQTYKKRFISKEAQHVNQHRASNKIIDYFTYSNYSEVPDLDKSTPTFGNFFGLRIYPTNIDNEIVLRFEHTLNNQPVKRQDFISPKDIADRNELETTLAKHEKKRLLAINDENSENFSMERKELDNLIAEGEEVERQGDFVKARKKYYEAADINRYYLKIWGKLSELHAHIPDTINLAGVLEEKRQITNLIKLEHNISNPKYIQGVKISNTSFFDDFDVEFKRVNLILGKNGYGKTYFLRLLAVLASQSKKGITDFFDLQSGQNTHTSNERESLQVLRLSDVNNNSSQYAISASKAYPDWIKSEIGQIPILAIPETRFIDKSSDHISRSERFDIRSKGSYHLIEQKSFSDIINNIFFSLGLEMLNKTIDEKPFLEFVKDIMKVLIGDTFFYAARPAGGFGDVRIDVLPQGSNRPIPIQKASKGTLSVISIFSHIYLYLNKLYPNYTGENLLKQSAIVFIDEIDAHLHPSWQNKVVHLLTETFPHIQFFLTAHSPLVVAGRYAGEVSVLRKTKNQKFKLRQAIVDFVGVTTPELYKIIFDIEDKDETYLSGYELEKKVELSQKEKKQYRIFKSARKERHELNRLEMSNYILESELKREQQQSDLEKEIAYLIRKTDLDDEEKDDLQLLMKLYEKSLDVQIAPERINAIINEYLDKRTIEKKPVYFT